MENEGEGRWRRKMEKDGRCRKKKGKEDEERKKTDKEIQLWLRLHQFKAGCLIET